MNGRVKRKLLDGQITLLVIALFIAIPVLAGEEDDRWWPTQAFPKAVVRTTNQQEFPEPRVALQMMVQSVAGLAAKAVNEGRGDELVWVNNGDGDLEKWYARLLARHPDLATPGAFEPWDLVDRYAKRGIIKGYILYRSDKSKGENNTGPVRHELLGQRRHQSGRTAGRHYRGRGVWNRKRKRTASSCCWMSARKPSRGVFKPTRTSSTAGCFAFKIREHPTSATWPSRRRCSRPMATANRLRLAMAWLEPLSPILGWNCGDEFENTDLSTGYGDIQTATDWSLNLPVLMAGTEKLDLPKAKSFDPRTIDWNDSRSAVAFIDTDGDNVQWLEGNFFGNDSYWGNPERGKIPFGWSCCFDQLAQLCPQAIEYALATRTTNDWFIEWGGGYYYPDRFGRERTNRWELLANTPGAPGS